MLQRPTMENGEFPVVDDELLISVVAVPFPGETASLDSLRFRLS